MLQSMLRSFARIFRKARSLVATPILPIDEALWRRATSRYAFVQSLDPEENRRLRLIAADFLSRKTIT